MATEGTARFRCGRARRRPHLDVVGAPEVRYSERCEPLAQSAEHLTFNQGVLGSIPRRLTKYYEDF